MNILKKGLFILVLGLWILSVITGCSLKKDTNEAVAVQLDFGYNDTIKVASYNPLVATIQNDGPAFVGELQIQVEDNMNGKVMIVSPFEMAQNSKKEITMEVPVYIIQKNFTVAVVSEGRTFYEEKIKPKKVLSPNQRVMAVITDTPDAYRFLENAKTKLVNQDIYSGKMVTAQVYDAVETEELEVLFFDSLESLKSLDQLSYFNYIYMGQNQSLTISESMEEVLVDWVEAGNCFIIETGANYQKMNSILPESLNPLAVEEVKNIMLENIWQGMPFDQYIDVAISSQTDKMDYFYQQEGEAIIGAVTQRGNGAILTLMVNMGLEPMASWNAKAPLMSSILQGIMVQSTSMNSDYYGGSPFQHLLSQVPVEKKTPYMVLFIIFMVYILLLAPVSYFILKKMDKRDFAWILIPIMAILCITTLYILGGNTRYTKAITNSISILTADEESKVMNISTDMYIFNNLKDHLVVEWDANENIQFNDNSDYMGYSGGYYREPDNNQNKKLTGKFTLGNPMKYEKYNAPLWATSYLSANKTIPFDINEKMVSMTLNDSEVLIKVKNTTPYRLMNAFVQWGQGYIMIGDLNPGDEKEVTKDFSAFISKPFEKFIQNDMGIKPYDYSAKRTVLGIASQRKYEMLMQRYAYTRPTYPGMTTTQSNFEKILLCALNDQGIGYDIKVNEDVTEDYATNIIEISSDLVFEKGSNIIIPEGIITPETAYYLDEEMTKVGTFEYQAYDQYLRFYEQGVASFSYVIPKGITLSMAHMNFGDVYTEQDYYNSQNGVAATPRGGILYWVWNNQDNIWESVDKKVDLDEKFVSAEGQIQLKVDLRANQQETDPNKQKDYSYMQMMMLPTISIEGSVE